MLALLLSLSLSLSRSESIVDLERCIAVHCALFSFVVFFFELFYFVWFSIVPLSVSCLVLTRHALSCLALSPTPPQAFCSKNFPMAGAS